MAAERIMDGFVSRLEDPNLDVRAKATAAQELRDNVDSWIQNGLYIPFLAKFVPVLLKLLDSKPVFVNTAPEQRIRNCALEIIHRFPLNQPDALKPYALSIVDKLISLFKIENEDNAVLLVKVFLALQRSPAVPADRIQKILDLIADLFENMNNVVDEMFNTSEQASSAPSAPSAVANLQHSQSPRPGSPAVAPPEVGQEQQPQRELLECMKSFKVMAECPIAVVSIFQQQKDNTAFVSENVTKFAPLVKGLLLLQAPPQEKAHAEAKAQGTVFVGVSKGIKNRTVYAEMIKAQVKTMSFLAYFLKSNGPLMQDFTTALPNVITRLLKDLPKEDCTTRKELLIATRHIVNFNFRKIFINALDELLDPRVLLGDGLAVYETLRTLAYSFLADLIHHLRDQLTEKHIRASIKVFTRNLADTYPGTSFQTMSAKLLMNIADKIAKMDDKVEARTHLIAILDAIGDKFAYLNRTYPNASKISARVDHHASEVSVNDFIAVKEQPPTWDAIDIFGTSPIKVTNTHDRGADPVFDNKFMFKNLVQGLKNIFYQLRACNPESTVDVSNAPHIWPEVASGFSGEEVQVLIKLFHEGIRVFQYYPSEKFPTDSQVSTLELIGSHHVVHHKEEKELLETFATVFHHVDPAVFHEVFHSEIPHMYEMMFDHPALLQVPQFLLASEATSPAFASMLLQFLMERIEDVGSSNIAKATILLRLFKLSFMAVTLFSQLNESVLLPHVHTLITRSIELATTAELPMHYFYLLRSLFRSIGGGRFEHLYKEILPLLEMLLDTLNKLIVSARKVSERDLYVELSLTVPARLSHLLPHLSYLMRPLPLALRAGSDLVGQGLRTLELCVDNLTADYLDPIMAPVIDDLMSALWEHLKPAPYSHFHAHTAMRILGKLGGRNRRFIEGPPSLEFEKHVDPKCQFDIKLVGASSMSSFPATFGVDVAVAKLEETPRTPAGKANDTFHKQQAFNLIVAQIKLLIGSSRLPDDFAQLVRLQADDLSSGVWDKGLDEDDKVEREMSIIKKESEQDTLKALIKALMLATSIPELKAEADAVLGELYRHFVILEVGRALADAKRGRREFEVAAGEGPWYLDHRVVNNAIIESLSSDKTEVRDAARGAIITMLGASEKIFGSKEKALKLPIFTQLLLACCHSCHSEEWYLKSGGSLGIHILATEVGPDLVADKQVDICRALIYAAKDLPDDVPRGIRTKALETLTIVIRGSNASALRDDVLNTTSKLHSVCMFLILELSSTSKPVREAAQQSLSLISGLASMEVHEIVAPMKANLFKHIFTKPLRSVGVLIQIGYIESIVYCLKLGHGVLEATDPLNRFLGETIKIAETIKVAQPEEEASQMHKVPDYRQAADFTKLQVSCLHLLSLAIDIPESQNPQSDRSRPKLITVFFKALYSGSIEVVDAAYDALKIVVAPQETKLPKDVLQQGLRPILVSLQDPTKLREENLKCLARLLQLLKNYFKVEIGHRLLENVSKVADMDTLQKASFSHVEQHERIRVLAAVFNVFHLLPEGAKDMMSRLVEEAIEIEQALRRTHFSPLRAPVSKYLNRYPEEAWNNLFSRRLHEQAHSRFFGQILAMPENKRLRDVVSADADTLRRNISTDSSNPDHWAIVINSISIVDSLSKFSESCKTLFAHEGLKQSLIEAGKSLEEALREETVPMSLRLAAHQSGEHLLRILASHISNTPSDLDCLFEFADGIASEKLRNMPGIWQPCIYENVISCTSTDRWRLVANRCVDIYTSKDHNEVFKAFVMRNFFNPILAMDAMRNWDSLMKGDKTTSFMNKALKESLRDRLWKPQCEIDPSDESTPTCTEFARMELLQMATLLLKYFTDAINDVRKEVVRFLWAFIRLEDVVLRYAAYVAVAYFISVYESPAKITMGVYSSLVRVEKSEARVLVVQALEVLAPVIPKRMANFDPSTPYPWIKATRKPILEDPSMVSQTQSILLFVARHPDLFYEAKEALTSMIVSVMPRIAPIPSTSLENKKSTLNLLTLLWSWQERFADEKEQGTITEASSKPDGTPGSPESPLTQRAKPYIPSANTRIMILKYLSQFIITLSDRYPVSSSTAKDGANPPGVQASLATDICKRSLELFQSFLSPAHWGDVDIDSVLPKMNVALHANPKPEKYDSNTTAIINTLQLFRVMVNVKPDEWIVNRLPQFRQMLEKLIRNPNPEIQESLHADHGGENDKPQTLSLLTRILKAIPQDSVDEEMEDADAPTSEFVSYLSTVATDTVSTIGGNNIAGINILLALSKCRPQAIDEQHVTNAMKILTQAVKDHLMPTNVQSQMAAAAVAAQSVKQTESAAQPQTQDTAATEASNDLIIKVMDFLASRVSQLGDHRRPYLQALSNLVEKSPSNAICSRILDLTHTWVFTANQVFPTVKEKVAIVIKMISFEHRPEQELYERFLDLIITVYEDSKITRSELAIRLESAFLIGTRAPNIAMRTRFFNLFDKHLSRSANKRLLYLLAAQDWHELRDSFWLSQVIQLLLGSVEQDTSASIAQHDLKTLSPSTLFSTYAQDDRVGHAMLDDDFEAFMAGHGRFYSQLAEVRAKNILEPLGYLQHTDSNAARQIWALLFPQYWSILAKDERSELQLGLVSLLTKEYHTRQMDRRPNCIQALIEGIARTENPRINFPHHLMKYLARTYNGWYTGLCYLEENAFNPIVDTPASRESNLDALAEMYASLEEGDMFYGLWRKRCEFLDTNTALSYEQHGNWEKAQKMFESATFKARTGAAPFKQGEYMLWEDHWVRCAQKLQQWDVLSDFAKNDNLNDLFLDAVWRNIDFWHQSKENQKHLENIIKGVSDAPTPRRAFFQSFMCLLKLHNDQESPQNFNRTCDESIQLSIRKWHQLPKRITNAHIPILQNFQQLVELYDASVICNSLSQTTQTNLDQKSPELKLLLSTWRDRLPNFWDDINAWQELVTWRQHIFNLINRKYLTLIPGGQQNNVAGNSLAYRGYHETASIINRFAHVARKHHLPDVCISQLSKIYTLPNIEIQEAFLKLREQAKCHYHNESELQVGLDVINNTNLNYFGQQQKAEFYTLKGMFLAKQNHMSEADEAFGSALFFDLKLPKAWAEWARYNDRLFKENSSDILKAANAISCYLEAAATYKNAKSRKFLSRVLWLLSLDDTEYTLARTFNEFKGEISTWYWITFIPQLLTSLSRQEGRITRTVLAKLARNYPQALYFSLRTSREDMAAIKRQQEARDAKAKADRAKQQGSPDGQQQASPPSRPNTAGGENSSRPGTANGEADSVANSSMFVQSSGSPPAPKQEPKQEGETETKQEVKQESNGDHKSPDEKDKQQPQQQQVQSQPQQPPAKKPWEYQDEIASSLKVAFPLLALSLETMVDQITRNMKASSDEDAFRLINALLNDAINYVSRSPHSFSMDVKVPAATESNILRFAESVLPPHLRKAFENDFVVDKPPLMEYIHKLRKWRDKFEAKLDRRNQRKNLESYGPHLSEFRFQKFDEVEVPGQYLLHKDSNKDFVRIERFMPDVDLVKGNSICHRRLWIRGHDGSAHPFSIQHPTARHSRRDERMLQMVRFFNDVLSKQKESRRRQINYLLPAIVPLTPAMRMVEDDPSYITLQGVHDDYCRRKRLSKDEAILFMISKLREAVPKTPEQVNQIKLQSFEMIQEKYISNTVALDYFQRSLTSYSDFWLFRRQFSYQLAAVSFLTYIMFIRERAPGKISIARATGNIWVTELQSTSHPNRPVFHHTEPVPFRLTPNLQMLLGPIALEGIFASAMLVIAKALTEPLDGTKLEQMISIFVRDEIIYVNTQQHRRDVDTAALRFNVVQNSELVVRRAQSCARPPNSPLPANQTVLDMVAAATAPRNLAHMDPSWMPWL